MKIGSLCTGYGGLDMATEAYFDAETVWVSEIDKYASQVIEQRFGVVNHGDLKIINWAEIEPIDILTAGYPCQPFSTAGNRKGENDERHIWPYIKKAISVLRPRFVILENVTGHLNLGFDQVLADLTQIGYDARWQIVRASDVGAPHHRARLFVIAYPKGGWPGNESSGISQSYTRISSDCESAANAISQGLQRSRRQTRRYRSSIEISDQEVPNPLDQGKLNAKYVEYMMGLTTGWVTDTGLSRSQQLKILGNGVVPQQAYYALELLATRP